LFGKTSHQVLTVDIAGFKNVASLSIGTFSKLTIGCKQF